MDIKNFNEDSIICSLFYVLKNTFVDDSAFIEESENTQSFKIVEGINHLDYIHSTPMRKKNNYITKSEIDRLNENDILGIFCNLYDAENCVRKHKNSTLKEYLYAIPHNNKIYGLLW